MTTDPDGASARMRQARAGTYPWLSRRNRAASGAHMEYALPDRKGRRRSVRVRWAIIARATKEATEEGDVPA